LAVWYLGIHADVKMLASDLVAHTFPQAANIVERLLSIEPIALAVRVRDELRVGDSWTGEPVRTISGWSTWEEAVHLVVWVTVACPCIEAIRQVGPNPLERHVLVRGWDRHAYPCHICWRVILVASHNKDGVEDELPPETRPE
jgi:hypothetical protein